MLVLPAELTHAQTTACLRMLVQGLRAEVGPQVTVDASALQHFDSSALALLLELRREGLAQGKALALQGMSARLLDLAALYGVAALLAVPDALPLK
jgi:phospholipid transport system transporter-binding protein